MPEIKPIQSRMTLKVLQEDQLAEIKTATLHILENTGVRVPSERARQVFASRGAVVDELSQIVKIPTQLVLEAMSHAPRAYTLSGRAENTDLYLDGKHSYFCTDGCGTLTVDFETGEQRLSSKQDVAKMARVADYLESISFYWPMVSAQDYGRLAPLHELEASFNNTVKHVQVATILGAELAHIAVRMGAVVSGGEGQMRSKPSFSLLVCTVAPLCQDEEGIEAAMVCAQAGIPVGFMSMPNIGSTAPATAGGALVIGNAEVVSAMVLIQLIAPGAPVFHSLLASVMDPHTADYVVSIPEKYLCNAAAVQMAHDWGVPSLAGAFGMDYLEPATWMLGRDSVYSALMVSLAGADMVVASGLLRASTLLLPEQIIFDDETYHIHRIIASGVDTSPEGLAVDVINAVGSGGNFLSQQHTSKHIREIWMPPLTHPRPGQDGGQLPDVRRRARAELDRIIETHQPQPLEDEIQKELLAILNEASQKPIFK